MTTLPPFPEYSEQDTVDTLILPYLSREFQFPKAESLDYQAQHNVPVAAGRAGRYDGLYLAGGYPYVVLEAKRSSHRLTEDDIAQAREYATSSFFDKPVPFLIVSNGHDHRFFKKTTTINPNDGHPAYTQIPPTAWKEITRENPGEVRQLLTEAQLLDTLRTFKEQTFNDVAGLVTDPTTGLFDLTRHGLGESLGRIIATRKAYVGDSSSSQQVLIRHSIEAVALHFTIKILFIKLIEDLARGADSPRVIHSLFPKRDYDQIGGLFGYKVLNALDGRETRQALRLFSRSKAFYRRLAQDLARVSWQDIFRYGFSVHMARFGQLFRARDYDRFLPSDATLAEIQRRLISIDIRTAVIYGSATRRSNVIGDIYERLIDEELRSGLGAVYTPDETMKFMVDLGEQFLKGFRGRKIVEPACGSGHFYREIYRRYVDEVFAASDATAMPRDGQAAHAEALTHVYGRDIDPFAVQLTLLSTFLEQLKDNISPNEGNSRRLWPADRSVDTQNSLDPITVDPFGDLDMETTADLATVRNRRASCRRSINPDLMIGNPPYGVHVVRGPRYEAMYDLRSHDSYGYFVANALLRLPEGRRLIYIVSSSFLTIGSHLNLRATILRSAKIVRIIKLHRATFPGIDIFPVVIELERCNSAESRNQNVYQFYDLWRFHPETHKAELRRAYRAILDDPEAQNVWPFDATIAKRYIVRQGIIERFSRLPIFEGRPSLYEFMGDAQAQEASVHRLDGSELRVRTTSVRGRQIAKLGDIASVRIGLQSGNNGRFYRVAQGVRGGATRGGYREVPMHQVVDESRLKAMTRDERASGFEVDDPSNDRFYVPLDKAGASDIDGGLLPLFWRPVEFYVDWSRRAVTEMKSLRGARFQNSELYFHRGISFSNTGIYSPTFRLGHGGVFDQKGSSIFCNVINERTLLGILCSTPLRYFAKNFVNHGVDAQPESLPIVLPVQEDSAAIAAIADEIITAQMADEGFDYRPQLATLDLLVSRVYGLTDDERGEIDNWYRRHYPKLNGEAADEP